MKPSNRFFIVFVFLMKLSFSVTGQNYVPCIVILNNGDTLKGFAKHRDFITVFDDIKFRNNLEADTRVIRMEEFKSFIIANKTFESVDESNKLDRSKLGIYMVLADGYYKLYASNILTQHGAGEVRFYLKRPNMPLYWVKRINYQKNLSEFMNDNAVLSSRILSGEYSFDELSKIVKLYNQWYLENKK